MPRDLPRALEPTVIRDVFSWDVVNWSRALPVWERWLPSGTHLRALAVGEREGGLSLWLALGGIDVVCSDVVDREHDAGPLHRRYNVQDLITYQVADARSLPFPDAGFDVVAFKSVLGDVGSRGDQQEALDEIHRVLRPGGVLLFAENLIASRLHQAVRRRFVPWAPGWRYLDAATDLDMFDSFAEREFHTWGVLGQLGRSEGQRRLLGRLDIVAARLVPSRAHYILYGACRK